MRNFSDTIDNALSTSQPEAIDNTKATENKPQQDDFEADNTRASTEAVYDAPMDNVDQPPLTDAVKVGHAQTPEVLETSPGDQVLMASPSEAIQEGPATPSIDSETDKNMDEVFSDSKANKEVPTNREEEPLTEQENQTEQQVSDKSDKMDKEASAQETEQGPHHGVAADASVDDDEFIKSFIDQAIKDSVASANPPVSLMHEQRLIAFM